MKPCIWYISKYVSPPAKVGAGGRGYLIMRELARMGYKSVIITSDSNQLTEVPKLNQPHIFRRVDGIELCWIRTIKYSTAKSLRRILSWFDFEWRLFRLEKGEMTTPDVIIVSSLSLLTILNGFLLRRRYKCRLVLEIRDIWPLTIIEEGGFSRWNPLVLGLGLIEKLGYRYADAVVGTMPNLGEHVANVLGEARATHCIPMAVDESALESGAPLPEDYIERYIPRDKFIVGHAGSIGISNALDTLFECAELMKENPKLHFLIVGDGDLRKHYERQFSHLPNLSFAPRVPKQMVQSVLSHCDLLYFSVHVSKVWQYGQSLNKVIDYMLSGRPIVASYSGYPSMINEADCGTFVQAGDAKALCKELQRFEAMTPGQLSRMGQNGRDWLLTHRRYKTLAENYLPILFPNNGCRTTC